MEKIHYSKVRIRNPSSCLGDTMKSILISVCIAILFGCDPVVSSRSLRAQHKVELAHSPSRWQRFPNSPVIVPGFQAKPGGPIGVNVADPSVLYDSTERKWKLWFATGWGEAKDKRLVIKYAESGDGISWDVQAVPALEPATNARAWDYTQVETPAVLKNPSAPPERRYMLWYAGGRSDAEGGIPRISLL